MLIDLKIKIFYLLFETKIDYLSKKKELNLISFHKTEYL